MTINELLKILVDKYKFKGQQEDVGLVSYTGKFKKSKETHYFVVYLTNEWDFQNHCFTSTSVSVYANSSSAEFVDEECTFTNPEDILNWMLNYIPKKLERKVVKITYYKEVDWPLTEKLPEGAKVEEVKL